MKSDKRAPREHLSAEHYDESGDDDANDQNERGPHDHIHALLVFLGPLPVLFPQPLPHFLLFILLLHYLQLFLVRGVPVILFLRLVLSHYLIVPLLLKVLHRHQPGPVCLEIVAFRAILRLLLRTIFHAIFVPGRLLPGVIILNGCQGLYRVVTRILAFASAVR